MKIIKPYTEFAEVDPIDGEKILKKIEICGRICYQSECKMTENSAPEFVRKFMKHEGILEHVSISVRFVVDRGVSHEIVRHRLASFCQESTRYCNYSKDRFGNEITVILPYMFSDIYFHDLHTHIEMQQWMNSCLKAERSYFNMIELLGFSPQEARAVLPNSLKTSLVMTANLREWRHFLQLRTDNAAHPEMRRVAIPLLKQFQETIPIVFDDIVPGDMPHARY